MPTLQVSATSRMKHLAIHSPHNRRDTLRDLYTFGLVSVFRRDSVLRIWEPLREAPTSLDLEPRADARREHGWPARSHG